MSGSPSLWAQWAAFFAGAASVAAALYGLLYFFFWPRFEKAVGGIVDKKLEQVVAHLNNMDGFREQVLRFGDAVQIFEKNVTRLQTESDRQARAIARLEGRLWPNRLPEDTGQ